MLKNSFLGLMMQYSMTYSGTFRQIRNTSSNWYLEKFLLHVKAQIYNKYPNKIYSIFFQHIQIFNCRTCWCLIPWSQCESYLCNMRCHLETCASKTDKLSPTSCDRSNVYWVLLTPAKFCTPYSWSTPEEGIFWMTTPYTVLSGNLYQYL